ncbi:FecR family protein [Hyphococcus sp.]|uniref:FecR family protein n=1 Tax=Hyphococcus sp. TaxID=2038636 RepID=UPI0035C6CFAB
MTASDRDNRVHHLKDRTALEEEAAQWVWRLDAEDAGPELRAEFNAWLKKDPRHARAVEEFKKVWGRLDELAVLKQDAKLKTVKRGVDEEERQRLVPVPLGVLRYGAIAASLILAVALTLFIATPRNAPHPPTSYATAVGQQRTIELADGSVIELNTNSIVDVEYADNKRLVRLSKGEAHFKVAKNPDRPFIAMAGDTAVRAVGTAFNVRLTPDAPVEVLVTEGKVEVTKKDMPAPRPATAHKPEVVEKPKPLATVYLEAGQRLGADMTEPEKVTSVSEAAIDRELAWRRGMLIFEGEPLENVVSELSRYSEARFIIVDDSIRDRRVGGYFRTDDVESLLSVLEHGLSIEVDREGDGLIMLRDASHG